MKRIVIFSDTHGNIHPCLRVLPGLGDISMVIHLGDTVTDCVELQGFYPHIPFVSVKGNNDWFSPVPTVTATELDGVKIGGRDADNYARLSGFLLEEINS